MLLMKVSNALSAIIFRASVLKNADGMKFEDALKKCDLQDLVQVSSQFEIRK